MKILKLTAENVKKLSVVEITPEPGKGLVIVAGKNDAGKSSVLDSIIYALGGEKSLPSKPVRRGEDKARVELDLGDYLVTRTITATGGGGLVVRDKDSKRLNSPQAVLDGLLGRYTFDPLEFKNQKPEARSETLRALVGLDFTAQEADHDRLYDERTAINRDIKALEVRVASVVEHQGVPAEEVDAAAIVKEQQEAIAKNNALIEFRSKATTAKLVAEQAADLATGSKFKCEQIADEIVRLEKQLTAEKERFEQLTSEAEIKLKTAQEFEADTKTRQLIDLDPFTARMQELQATNRKVQANKLKADLRKQLRERTKQAESLASKIEGIQSAKRKAIQDAKFPVEGLSLSDTREVLFNGIPFDQVNTAGQLRISVAIGLALNPKLKVLLIHQGNDLDDENLAVVGEMAAAAGAQIWLERVSTSGDVSVIIEDGHVAETGTKEPKTETVASKSATKQPETATEPQQKELV